MKPAVAKGFITRALKEEYPCTKECQKSGQHSLNPGQPEKTMSYDGQLTSLCAISFS